MNTELTPKQAAEMAGVNVRTVYSWIRRGISGKRLRAIKKQGRVVIYRSDFDCFLEDTTEEL